MKTGTAAGPAPEFVKALPNRSVKSSSSSASSGSTGGSSSDMYDVVVAGGTLGVFAAAALAARGWRVAVVERGKLQGRTQVTRLLWMPWQLCWHTTTPPA